MSKKKKSDALRGPSKGLDRPRSLVFILPGAPFLCADYMSPLADRLCRALSAESVVVDYPGHGLMPSGSSCDYAGVLKAVADRFQAETAHYETVYVVAHSLGAKIAIESGILRERVQHAVLLNLPFRLSSSEEFSRKVRELNIKELRPTSDSEFDRYFRAIAGAYFSDGTKIPRNHPLFNNLRYSENVRMLENAPFELLGEVACDFHVILGGADTRCERTDREAMQLTFGLSQISILPNVGHFPMIESLDSLVEKIMSKIER